jgi:hypothetical protein
MGAFMLGSLLGEIKAAGRITDKDVVRLRMAIFPDSTVSADEAEDLFALNDAANEVYPAWRELFVEAMVDYTVRQMHPAGYVDEAGASWLIARIGADGVVKTDSELELLVKVLEVADCVPDALVIYALEQVKAAVLNGDGPLACGGKLEPGRINAAETALVRRVMYAAGGAGNLAISRREAEVLFDINDAARLSPSGGQDNDPAWRDLFAKAIAASVMTVSGYTPLSSAEETRREAWLTTSEEGVGGFMWKLFCGLGSGAMAVAHPQASVEAILHPADADLDEWNAHNADVASRLAAAEPVDQGEAEWLVERIQRDGVVDEAERALLAFIAAESPSVHPCLRPLIDQVSAGVSAAA